MNSKRVEEISEDIGSALNEVQGFFIDAEGELDLLNERREELDLAHAHWEGLALGEAKDAAGDEVTEAERDIEDQEKDVAEAYAAAIESLSTLAADIPGLVKRLEAELRG